MNGATFSLQAVDLAGNPQNNFVIGNSSRTFNYDTGAPTSALTNIGMVLPLPGYLEGMQAIARKHGTLLIIDETHTISTGYGGYTRMHGLQPDFLTLGKPVVLEE